MKKLLTMLLTLSMLMSLIVIPMSVSAVETGSATPAALPFTQDYDGEEFSFTQVTGDRGTQYSSNFGFYMDNSTSASWEAVEYANVDPDGKVAKLTHSGNKFAIINHYFSYQQSGKIKISFDTMVKSGSMSVLLNANNFGLAYTSHSTDVVALTFSSDKTIGGFGKWCTSTNPDATYENDAVYPVELIYDIDEKAIYALVNDTVIATEKINEIDTSAVVLTGMVKFGGVTFKVAGEAEVYIDNFTVEKLGASEIKIDTTTVGEDTETVNVVGKDKISVNAPMLDEDTLSSAKVYDLGASSIVKQENEITVTPQKSESGATFTLASAFENGHYYRIDLTGIKTLYGSAVLPNVVEFKCDSDNGGVKTLDHDFKLTPGDLAKGAAIDTAMAVWTKGEAESTLSIVNVTDAADAISDGYALLMNDTNNGENAETVGFKHSLTDPAFNIDTTQGGTLNIQLKFRNFVDTGKTGNDDYYGGYSIYLEDEDGGRKHLFKINSGHDYVYSGAETITEKPYNSSYLTKKGSQDYTTLNMNIDLSNNKIQTEHLPLRTGKNGNYLEDNNKIFDYNYGTKKFVNIVVLNGNGKKGGYFDYFNVSYTAPSVNKVTKADFVDYKDAKHTAYAGKTVPASTKQIDFYFDAEPTVTEMEAVTVKKKGTDASIGTLGAYADGKCTLAFDNYLEANTTYVVTAPGESGVEFTTDAGVFEVLSSTITCNDETATYTINVINTLAKEPQNPKKLAAAVAAYDVDGDVNLLTGINAVEVEATGPTVVVTLPVTGITYDKVKGFVWDSFGTIKPYFKSAEYPAQN